jgi:hypothetical protein
MNIIYMIFANLELYTCIYGLSLFGFGDPFIIVLTLAPTWSGL